MKVSRRELIKNVLGGAAAAGVTAILVRPDHISAASLGQPEGTEVPAKSEPVTEDLSRSEALPEKLELQDLGKEYQDGVCYRVRNMGHRPIRVRYAEGWHPKSGEEQLFAMMSMMSGSPVFPGGESIFYGPIELLTETAGNTGRVTIQEYNSVGECLERCSFML